jgi:hypothetical protein
MNIINYSPISGIEVIDNSFSLAHRFDINEAVKKSVFRIGWADNTDNAEHNIFSQWSPDDLNRIKFFKDFAGDHPLADKMNPDKFLRCIVNNETTSNVHWTHTHINENVLLYYVNMEWKDEWGGETLFFDRSNRDIVFGSRFTPGRMIWFDGEHPHTIKQPSRVAPKFRFTISIFFKK